MFIHLIYRRLSWMPRRWEARSGAGLEVGQRKARGKGNKKAEVASGQSLPPLHPIEELGLLGRGNLQPSDADR